MNQEFKDLKTQFDSFLNPMNQLEIAVHPESLWNWINDHFMPKEDLNPLIDAHNNFVLKHKDCIAKETVEKEIFKLECGCGNPGCHDIELLALKTALLKDHEKETL